MHNREYGIHYIDAKLQASNCITQSKQKIKNLVSTSFKRSSMFLSRDCLSAANCFTRCHLSYSAATFGFLNVGFGGGRRALFRLLKQTKKDTWYYTPFEPAEDVSNQQNSIDWNHNHRYINSNRLTTAMKASVRQNFVSSEKNFVTNGAWQKLQL